MKYVDAFVFRILADIMNLTCFYINILLMSIEDGASLNKCSRNSGILSLKCGQTFVKTLCESICNTAFVSQMYLL